jgi:hypothetical protein
VGSSLLLLFNVNNGLAASSESDFTPPIAFGPTYSVVWFDQTMLYQAVMEPVAMESLAEYHLPAFDPPLSFPPYYQSGRLASAERLLIHGWADTGGGGGGGGGGEGFPPPAVTGTSAANLPAATVAAEAYALVTDTSAVGPGATASGIGIVFSWELVCEMRKPESDDTCLQKPDESITPLRRAPECPDERFDDC